MPITINNYNEHLRKYCDACGIKYRSSHKIRFYNCSKMYEKGVDEKKIQTDMGHSSLSMTRHYDRRKAKPMQEDLVEELFGYDSLEAAKNRSFLKVI